MRKMFRRIDDRVGRVLTIAAITKTLIEGLRQASRAESEESGSRNKKLQLARTISTWHPNAYDQYNTVITTTLSQRRAFFSRTIGRLVRIYVSHPQKQFAQMAVLGLDWSSPPHAAGRMRKRQAILANRFHMPVEGGQGITILKNSGEDIIGAVGRQIQFSCTTKNCTTQEKSEQNASRRTTTS